MSAYESALHMPDPNLEACDILKIGRGDISTYKFLQSGLQEHYPLSRKGILPEFVSVSKDNIPSWNNTHQPTHTIRKIIQKKNHSRIGINYVNPN